MTGLELGRLYFEEIIRPILEDRFPGLVYSAARLGAGSDVLGFDDDISRDHDWGPKLDLYLAQDDHVALEKRIDEVLSKELPATFRGYATRFDLNEDGSADFGTDTGRHAIFLTTVPEYFERYLGFGCGSDPDTIDWLTMSPQKLRTVTSGRVYHDGLGQLENIQSMLGWYPHDIWLYLMANQWRRIDQEEPFVGRTGDVGDELGSRIIGTRQITELMTLCFLMERQYPPYFKWFGTAFSKLDCASELSPHFTAALDSTDWKARERHLSAAYLTLGRMHNALDVTEPVEPRITPFHSRAYLVPHSERFVIALHKAITDEEVLTLPRHIGALWQFADSTDILSSADRLRRLAAIYPDRTDTT